MDDIDPRLEPLLALKGVGPGTIRSLIAAFGGVDGLLDVLESGDIGKLAGIDRVSGRLAVNLVLAYRGLGDDGWFGGEGIRVLHGSIVDGLRSRMRTERSRNRCALLMPRSDLRAMRSAAEEVANYSKLVVQREKVEKLLAALDKVPERRVSKIRSDLTLVVEDEAAYARVREMGLDRHCLVTDASELTGSMEGPIIYVYNGRELDESVIPAIAFVSCMARPYEILPSSVLERFIPSKERFRTVSELQAMFGTQGVSGAAVKMLDELVLMDAISSGRDLIENTLEAIRDEVGSSLKGALARLTLTGEDTLAVLSNKEPASLKEVYRDHSRMALSMVKERLGMNADLFRMRYPVEIDQEALDAAVSEIEGRAMERSFRRKVEIASSLMAMEDDLERELEWAYDLDYRFGLGCAVTDLDLRPFEQAEGWFGVCGASHLDLRGGDGIQTVDYHLGEVPRDLSGTFRNEGASGSRIAILTGANSGGKTTLLETMAQVVLMAHMGLPVPARCAFVPQMRNLHLYRPKKHMDAGGLESFLKEFLPLCLDAGPGSMVLADELEAMTELEAATSIVRSFLLELEAKGAFAVVVTHLAGEVARGHPFRVDGIEAKGLDEDYNLIVDRTPRICHHARSMPELILRRLHGTSHGRERDLYGRILHGLIRPSP